MFANTALCQKYEIYKIFFRTITTIIIMFLKCKFPNSDNKYFLLVEHIEEK